MKTAMILTFAIALSACGDPAQQEGRMNNSPEAIIQHDEFNKYWYNNAAEISRYKLEQGRYGQINEGDVVLIFVTEDLGDESHVKNDQEMGGKSIPVLKLNYVKHFITGIYDYSMMSSIFTPVDQNKNGNSLRVTSGAQEWCGHAYTSIDLRNAKYEIESHSYFEGEADKKYSVDQAILEDELFNLIRLDPKKLPVGELQMIPSTMYCRLMHVDPKPLTVAADLKKEEKRSIYTVYFPELDRELAISFNNEFPYQIQGWEETYESGWGDGKKKLTTKATLTHTRISPYWTENSVKDLGLRKELGL